MEAGRLQNVVCIEGKKDGLFVGGQKLRVAESWEQRRRGLGRRLYVAGRRGSPSVEGGRFSL